MRIGGFEPCTVTDFPNKVASIIFTIGCNFRCPYCYNKDLLSEIEFSQSERKIIDVEKTISYLDKYKGMIDGVVLTGGEPTIHSDIIDLAKLLKEKGFEVKLDTNGSNPGVLAVMIANDYVDYVAMDIKGPLSKYREITGYSDMAKILESINLLKIGQIPHEFRITLYPVLIKEDIVEAIKLVPGELVYLQQFNPEHAQDNHAKTLLPMSKEDIDFILEKTKDIADVRVRE